MSGYCNHSNRSELDRLLWIDAARLNQWGYFDGVKSGVLTWANSFNEVESRCRFIVNISDPFPYLQLQYAITDEYSDTQKRYDYKIGLTTTMCNFGGKRWWFVCPLAVDGFPCRRRVRKLYQSDERFGCRTCQNLCYATQNETRSGLIGMLRVFGYTQKAEDLYEQIKVPFYNGKPTRKFRRYLRLRMAANDPEILEELSKLIEKKNV